MSLVKMSFSAAVIIFIIIVIRALAINHLPKKTFIALWGIALVRLLVPFSWPSPLSIYSFTNRSGAGQTGNAPLEVVLRVVPTAARQNFAPAARFSPLELIWGIGLILCALYFVIAYIRCYRSFKTSEPIENAFTAKWLAGHNCMRPVTIRQANNITAPLTYGIFRPVILMPSQTDWTDTLKLQYILAHEYVHIRRFDSISKLLLTAALSIHWFNPLVWVMYILANRDIELSCDEKVVRLFGETIKSSYALTLIDMVEKKSGLTPLCSHFSKYAIEERIEAIMKIKKASIFTLVTACAVVTIIGSTFATSAAESTPKNPPAIKEVTAISPNFSYAYKFLPTPEIYAKYSSYGISISDNGEMLLYNGQRVRLFIDEHSDTESFFLDEEGSLDLSVIRNAAGNITGIESISESKAQEYRSAFFADDTNSNVEVKGIVPETTPDITDKNKFGQYTAYGIIYSIADETLTFNGQRVKFFIDQPEGEAPETLWTDENGTVNASVIRDASGQITAIENISDKKAREYEAEVNKYAQNSLDGIEKKVEAKIKELYPEN